MSKMITSKTHLIDEEVYQNLLEMLFSDDVTNHELAGGILINADYDDLTTLFYIDNLIPVIMSINTIDKENVLQFYNSIKKGELWDELQEHYKEFNMQSLTNIKKYQSYVKE